MVACRRVICVNAIYGIPHVTNSRVMRLRFPPRGSTRHGRLPTQMRSAYCINYHAQLPHYQRGLATRNAHRYSSICLRVTFDTACLPRAPWYPRGEPPHCHATVACVMGGQPDACSLSLYSALDVIRGPWFRVPQAQRTGMRNQALIESATGVLGPCSDERQ